MMTRILFLLVFIKFCDYNGINLLISHLWLLKILRRFYFAIAILGKSVTAIKARNSAWLDGGFHIFLFSAAKITVNLSSERINIGCFKISWVAV